MQLRNATDHSHIAGPLRRSLRGRFALLVPLAVLTSAAGAYAQQDGALPAGEPRFNVELIVFTYRSADSGNEIFVPDRPKLIPDAEEELPAGTATDSFGDVPEETETDLQGTAIEPGDPEGKAPERERIELLLLEPDEYTMDDVYQTLRRLDAYQPIMRAAWTQTTPTRDASPAVHLRALGSPPRGLDGSVTLYRGRYLHLVVDLALDAESTGDPGETATDRLVAYGDGRVRGDDDSALSDLITQPVRYRIFEDRIMKTGDLRYFDHPRFGVIAKVTRPEEDPASEETALGIPGNGTPVRQASSAQVLMERCRSPTATCAELR